MLEASTTPISKTTFPSGIVVTRELFHTPDLSNNGYDSLSMIKRIEFPDDCNNKLKSLGIDTVEFSKEFNCKYGSKIPFRKSQFKAGTEGMVSFWHGKGLMRKEYLGSFYAKSTDEIKNFFKVLENIKVQELPLNGKTVEFLMKLIR